MSIMSLRERDWKVLLGICAVGSLIPGAHYGKSPSDISCVAVETHCQTQASRSLKYLVLRFHFPADKKRAAIVLVTVDPEHFNRVDMIALAAELNKEFSEQPRMKAALFDDENTVRLFVAGGLEIPELDKSQRGMYELDRIKCKEYIQFSTRKGRPRNETTIRFKCSVRIPLKGPQSERSKEPGLKIDI